LGKKLFKTSIISIFILCLVAMGAAYAQKKPVPDFKFEAKGTDEGSVTFSHEKHSATPNSKCTDCHTKIFKMKKSDLKMTHADFTEGKYCGTCHDGKKAYSAADKDSCGKCHKK